MGLHIIKLVEILGASHTHGLINNHVEFRAIVHTTIAPIMQITANHIDLRNDNRLSN